MGREMDWFIVELGLCFNGGSVTAATHNTTSEYRTRAFILWAIVDLCRLLKRCFVSSLPVEWYKSNPDFWPGESEDRGNGTGIITSDSWFRIQCFLLHQKEDELYLTQLKKAASSILHVFLPSHSRKGFYIYTFFQRRYIIPPDVSETRSEPPGNWLMKSARYLGGHAHLWCQKSPITHNKQYGSSPLRNSQMLCSSNWTFYFWAKTLGPVLSE